MAENQRFLVDFPNAIIKKIKQHQGILGESESEVIKNLVFYYIKEKGLLRILKTSKIQEGDGIG